MCLIMEELETTLIEDPTIRADLVFNEGMPLLFYLLCNFCHLFIDVESATYKGIRWDHPALLAPRALGGPWSRHCHPLRLDACTFGVSFSMYGSFRFTIRN